MSILSPISGLGSATLSCLGWLGSVAGLAGETARALVAPPVRLREIARQVVAIGFGAQAVIVITGAFTGAVFAAQMHFRLADAGLGSAVGPIVSLAMCRELGPVLTGLMLAGWGGAAIAAELGSMKVGGQIDALRSFGVPPAHYLVKPRLAGMLLSVPLLVAEATGFGILAGKLVAVHIFGIPSAWFARQIAIHTGWQDIAAGMIKGFVFAGLIALIAAHCGLRARGGAAGVGRAATRAFVYSSLAILIVNLFLSFLLNAVFPMAGA